MNLRVIAMAVACAFAYYIGTVAESLNTHKSEMAYANYRESVIKNQLTAIERLQGQRDEQDNKRRNAEKDLGTALTAVASQRAQLSDYATRLERLQHSHKTSSTSNSEVPCTGTTTTSCNAKPAPTEAEFSGSLGAAAIQMIPEADEYLLRLRECSAYVTSIQYLVPK